MTTATNNLATESWAIADLLRGDFKQSQYGQIILPFCLLRRLECVLGSSKDAVLAEYEKVLAMNLSEEAQDELLLRATKVGDQKLSFYNTSKLDLTKLGERDTKANLESYTQSFSKNVREIFESFNFSKTIEQLDKAELLHKVVQKVCTLRMDVEIVSKFDIGQIFEELIRRFAEGSNETIGEYFTPRDIVRLATLLVFSGDEDMLMLQAISRTIYDPTTGSGGFLSAGIEFVHTLNSNAVMHAFGQELNTESYAICKANMLVLEQEISNIKLGNTLSKDCFSGSRFDYVLSHPPFGVSWKTIEDEIVSEWSNKEFEGRFGAGLPRKSDSSLLFVLHAVDKLKKSSEGGGRAAIILNRSSLVSGSAGSGECRIRRYLMEKDLVEAIVILPREMMFQTSIQTYVLILSTKKRFPGLVKVLDTELFATNMRRSLGSKRKNLDQDAVEKIIELYSGGVENEYQKIYQVSDFGFRDYKINFGDSCSERERMPLNVRPGEYLQRNLNAQYPGFVIDQEVRDEFDHRVGLVGYELLPVVFQNDQCDGRKQFRFYFDEAKTNWLFAISRSLGNVVFASESAEHERSANYLYFIPKTNTFSEKYLRLYFESEAWEIWKFDFFKENGQTLVVSTIQLMRQKILFPRFESQGSVVELFEEIAHINSIVSDVKRSVWTEPESSLFRQRIELPKVRNAEQQLIEISPNPFANLLHHFRGVETENFKERYEILLKLVENLATFSCGVLVGFLEDKLDPKSLNGLMNIAFGKGYVTFGTWTKMLRFIRKECRQLVQDSDFTLLEIFINDDFIEILSKFKSIRDETVGHGSHPTQAKAKASLIQVENLFEELQERVVRIFENIRVVRPNSSTWDGVKFTSICDEFSGLGTSPFNTLYLESNSPTVSGSLYVIAASNRQTETLTYSTSNIVLLFPFVILTDDSESIGLENFYFYRGKKEQDKGEKKAENDLRRFSFSSHQQIARQEIFCANPKFEKYTS